MYQAAGSDRVQYCRRDHEFLQLYHRCGCTSPVPLIPNLAASAGLSSSALFACTIIGAQSSAISPFSSGGSLILGSTPKEEDRNMLFNRLLMVAVTISVLFGAVYNFALAMIL